MLLNFLFLISLYLPFQLALNPTAGVDLASIRVLILLLFFFWLANALKNKKLIIKSSLVTTSVAIFLFLNLFSFFFAQNTDWSGRKLLFLFSIFPLYFVAANILNTKEKAEKIIRGLVISAALSASLGLVQFFSQFIFGLEKLQKIWSDLVISPFLGKNFTKAVFDHPSWFVDISGHTYFRAISIFPDPHMFSFFLGLILPFSLSLFLIHKKKIWLVFSGIIFFADILTFSRGGYLGLIAGFLFLLFIFWKNMGRKYLPPHQLSENDIHIDLDTHRTHQQLNKKERNRLSWCGGVAAILLGGVTLFSAFFVPNPITSRLLSSFNFKEGSNAGRIEMWEKAREVISDNPLTGVGIGNFPLEINPLSGYREPIYAHNTYLDISVDAGILAGLAWIGILVFALAKFLKKSEGDIISSGAAISLVIFSTHSLVDTGIYSPVVLTVFLIIISLSSLRTTKVQRTVR